MTILTFIIGLVMIVGGVFAIKYNYQLTNNFAAVPTVEKLFGPGREYAFYKMVAVIIIVAGFIVMFGFYDNVTNFLLSPFKGLFELNEESF